MAGSDDWTPLQRYQRRADDLQEARYNRLERKVDDLDTKVDTLSIRLAYAVGILGFISVLANIVGPVIVQKLLGG